MNAKPASKSRVEMTQIVLPGDANNLDTAFGGKIMQWIDIAAAVAARRHSSGIAVTASMDSLQFLLPIFLGDVVVLRASVNRSWNSSMEVGVRVEREDIDTGQFIHAATAYLTFVAIDESRNPRNVPELLAETENELRRFEKAGERRTRRLQEREA